MIKAAMKNFDFISRFIGTGDEFYTGKAPEGCS